MSKNFFEPRRYKAIVIMLAVGVLIGLIVAALIMYIAWDHNPQQEYHEPGNIHWGHWFGLGFLWFVMVGGGFSLVIAIISVAIIWLSSKSQDTPKKRI